MGHLMIDDVVLARLRSLAEQNGRSVEDEAQAIITDAVRTTIKPGAQELPHEREARIQSMREFAAWSEAALAKQKELPAGTIVSMIREDRDR